MSNQANAAKRSDDGTKRRKTAKTGKKGRTGDRTTVPEEWHGVAVPRGTVVPPWHSVTVPCGTVVPPGPSSGFAIFLFKVSSGVFARGRSGFAWGFSLAISRVV